MDIESKTKVDIAYEWICRIIETCNNQFHFDGIDRLIELFGENFKDENKVVLLKNIRNQKFAEVHNILY